MPLEGHAIILFIGHELHGLVAHQKMDETKECVLVPSKYLVDASHIQIYIWIPLFKQVTEL